MKYLFYIISFLLLSTGLPAQKLSLRVNMNVIQFLKLETTGRINVDSTNYNGLHHYVDRFAQFKKVSFDFPGASLEFRCRSNVFFQSGLKYTINRFNSTSASEDIQRTNPVYNLHRAIINWETGYYFRGSRSVKPFIAAGVSLTKFFARFEDENFNVYSAYLKYINATPFFLSGYFHAGLKHGAFSIGTSYSLSLTPVSNDGKLKSFKSFALITFSSDIARSYIIKKRQYKTIHETDDLKITRAQVLKQSETSWSIGVPYYRFVNNYYLDAYNDGTYNYRIEPQGIPAASFIPNINVNNINAMNTKRTWYYQSNLGYANVRINYKNVKTVTNSTYYVTPDNRPLNSGTSDITVVYNAFWLGIGNGHKIKTTRRSFIYADYDVKINWFKRKKKVEEWEIPPIKKLFLTVSVEGGLKFNHMGIALSLDRNVGKMDKYEFYHHMYTLCLKFVYDVASR